LVALVAARQAAAHDPEKLQTFRKSHAQKRKIESKIASIRSDLALEAHGILQARASGRGVMGIRPE
jgi:hypothetical protein